MSRATLSRHESNASYHADCEHIGHSMMATFPYSPRLYYELFVAKSRTRNGDTSDALAFGSLVHTCVLQPKLLDTDYVVSETSSRRGKAWAATVVSALEGNAIPILASQRADAETIADAVLLHPPARKLLGARGDVEASIRWTDADTGLLLKCKPDKLVDDPSVFGEVLLCVDLKTARDPRPERFQLDAERYGYYSQAAHYQDGVRALHPERTVLSLLLVVGKSAPHDVWLYQLDEADIEAARIENRETLRQIAECHRTGVWARKEQYSLQTLSRQARRT